MEIFDQWADYLKADVRKRDGIFAPWIALAELKDAEFATQAPALAAKFAADKSINELVAQLFSPAPQSIAALAEGYGKLFRETERLHDKGEKLEEPEPNCNDCCTAAKALRSTCRPPPCAAWPVRS